MIFNKVFPCPIIMIQVSITIQLGELYNEILEHILGFSLYDSLLVLETCTEILQKMEKGYNFLDFLSPRIMLKKERFNLNLASVR